MKISIGAEQIHQMHLILVGMELVIIKLLEEMVRLKMEDTILVGAMLKEK